VICLLMGREGDLVVVLDGDEIVVTKPGTLLLLAYRKSIDEPRLILTRSSITRTRSTTAITEFRAQAIQAAIAKARELGWIV
jgi:hypothetical protein